MTKWVKVVFAVVDYIKFNNLCSLLSSQSEREEFETEYKQKYERERVLLIEENKKLSSELDKVRYLFWKHPHKSGFSWSFSIPVTLYISIFLSCFLSFVVICLSL